MREILPLITIPVLHIIAYFGRAPFPAPGPTFCSDPRQLDKTYQNVFRMNVEQIIIIMERPKGSSSNHTRVQKVVFYGISNRNVKIS